MPEAIRAKSRDARIAVIGAGPGGLATAWFLKQHGFKNVLVLEERGSVGGLCHTLTEDYCSFDLGANYLASSYRETRRIARAVGAKSYAAHPWIAVRVPPSGREPSPRPLDYIGMSEVIRELRDDQGNFERKVSTFALAMGVLRFVWKRWRLPPEIDAPTLEGIHRHQELCKSFRAWLEDEGLGDLRSLFEIPITLMGYGFLKDIAAPYALRFLTLRLFISMCLRQIPIIGPLFPWPRRFVYGFQRMWEAVSWRLNVRCNVDILSIKRSDDPNDPDPVEIRFKHPERIFKRYDLDEDTLYFDHLVIACVRAGSLGHREPSGDEILDRRDEERAVIEKVHTENFAVTTVHTKPIAGKPPFRTKRPVVCAVPFIYESDVRQDQPIRPWVLVQLWGEQSDMLQAYTRLPDSAHKPGVVDRSISHKKQVIAGVVDLIRLLGGDVYPIEGLAQGEAGDEKKQRWESYMQWPYFGRVKPEDISDGWFDKLEELQGKNHTYRVGGATCFEAVEPIVVYAKHLVEKHFAGLR